MGISISYDRVLELEDWIATTVCEQFAVVAQIILLSYHFLPLVKVTYFSFSCSHLSELSGSSYHPPFLSSAVPSLVMKSSLTLSISPASELLSYYHDCELTLCETLPSFSYFLLHLARKLTPSLYSSISQAF